MITKPFFVINIIIRDQLQMILFHFNWLFIETS